ncbi:hypothetical protein O181_103885 [Austropuccinia psidii MF-1]|uniref:Uncharacterized protein n=1 Tax=Austropuccinia psidii MF-1 TaxID=1389203 RepID=A0A9Q3PK64_9BASI|nr:hypothetical protein [Austropuccinia psidii MF-1]
MSNCAIITLESKSALTHLPPHRHMLMRLPLHRHMNMLLHTLPHMSMQPHRQTHTHPHMHMPMQPHCIRGIVRWALPVSSTKCQSHGGRVLSWMTW